MDSENDLRDGRGKESKIVRLFKIRKSPQQRYDPSLFNCRCNGELQEVGLLRSTGSTIPNWMSSSQAFFPRIAFWLPAGSGRSLHFDGSAFPVSIKWVTFESSVLKFGTRRPGNLSTIFKYFCLWLDFLNGIWNCFMLAISIRFCRDSSALDRSDTLGFSFFCVQSEPRSCHRKYRAGR